MARKKVTGVSGMRVVSYLRSGTVAPRIEEIFKGDPWVWFGRKNDFPERMRLLADNCGPLERCMHTLAMLIAGDGIKFYTKAGEEIPEAVAAFDGLMDNTTQEDFLFASAYDIAFLNARSWMVRRAFGGAPARLAHVDVSRVRSEDINLETMKVPAYWWSANWPKRQMSKRYEARRVEAYGDSVAASELMYAKGYKQGRDIYGEPWWMGAIKAAEVWASIDKYNQSQIDSGFHPAIHLHTFTTLQGDALKEYDRDVQAVYTGPASRSMIHTYSSPGENMAPLIKEIGRGDHAGELDNIADRCERVIANAYGMPLALMGIETKAGMEGAGKALEQALELVTKTLVAPKQQMITKDLVKLLNGMGMAQVWEARIEPLKLIADSLDSRFAGEAYLRSTTVDEHRVNVLQLPELGGEDGERILKEPKEQSVGGT